MRYLLLFWIVNAGVAFAQEEVLTLAPSAAFSSACRNQIEIQILRATGQVRLTQVSGASCEALKTSGPIEFKIDRDTSYPDGRVIISASFHDQVLLIVDYRHAEARVIPRQAPNLDEPMKTKAVLIDVNWMGSAQARWFLLK